MGGWQSFRFSEKNISSAQLDLIQRVAGEASLLGLLLYCGRLRSDLLLGHPGLDFDLVVEGDAIKLAGSPLRGMAAG